MDDGHLTVGTDLTAVFWDGDQPRPVRTHVHAEAPFYLSGPDSLGERSLPEPALLLWTRGDEVMMADARVTHSENGDHSSIVGMQVGEWRSCDDRRRYPRFPCSASVAVRAFQFELDGPRSEPMHGRTRDLSMSGAYVYLPEKLDLGTVVEFHAVLAPLVVVRALSVITRHPEDGGMGIAFLEFLGDSHNDLETYLTRVA